MSSSPKASVLLIHGAYHPPACYANLTSGLQQAGYEVVTPRLASLGKDVVGVALEEDIAVIHKAAETLFESDKDVVLVGHSYGGFCSMVAAREWGVAERQAQGKKGGFKEVVYISGTLVNKGGCINDACNQKATTPPDLLEVFEFHPIGDQMSVSVRNNELTKKYYHYPAPAEAVEKTVALLEPQSIGVFTTLAPSGPSDVSIPQTYIVNEKDNIVLLEVQERLVAEANMKAVRLPECGHAPFLSHPKEVVDAIIAVASN